ncbi:inorganic triphosphatase [Roseateles chitinivorans]|uniref:CYTH domain-containing protein n=1 Tax=Roseateles chitinivorans TaxID=2917965 RepID=UPI003D66D926
MNEIELRFQIPESQWPAVRRWVAGTGKSVATEERLQASYFDTPERDLARAGFALRLRREGEVWVQTLKGAAPDGMTRLEHNVPLGADIPQLDVARHADHPAGQALQALLAELPEGPCRRCSAPTSPGSRARCGRRTARSNSPSTAARCSPARATRCAARRSPNSRSN